MVTIIILIAIFAIKCTVSLGTAIVACTQIGMAEVGALAVAGAEILFEVKGLVTILKIGEKKDREDD